MSRTPQQAQHQEKLQQVTEDRATYAAGVVSRWEDAARASGRSDANSATDLYVALMKLSPDNLLAASEASSFEAMMGVLAAGSRLRTASPAQQGQVVSPALGDTYDDLVYTPVAPCRIVDTRLAVGAFAANTLRSYDMDGSTFSSQGGFAGSCGIPFGVAQAVTMNITVTQPDGVGFLNAWRLASPAPNASLLNFSAGWTVANTTIIPVFPGGGNDFNVYVAEADAHVIIDVLGYFAAPVATALDCTTAASASTSVPNGNGFTSIDTSCPVGRTATGGGYDGPTIPAAGFYVTSLPIPNGWRTWVKNQTGSAQAVTTYVNCCRVPGR